MHMKSEGRHHWSDYEIVEFWIVRRGKQGKKQDRNTRSQENIFWSVRGSTWKNPVEPRIQEKWLTFNDPLLQAQENVHPRKKKSKQRQQEACKVFEVFQINYL